MQKEFCISKMSTIQNLNIQLNLSLMQFMRVQKVLYEPHLWENIASLSEIANKQKNNNNNKLNIQMYPSPNFSVSAQGSHFCI